MKSKQRIRAFFLTLTLSIFHQSASASGHVSGELGLWLHNRAGPAISQLVNEHPRFIGESIRIVALNAGRPGEIDNELAQRIRGSLQQELLDNSSVRLPLDHADSCYAPDVNIVLGIEVSRHDRLEHRVMLAFLDLDENVWINQSAQLWVGRLSTHQKNLLSKSTNVLQTTFHEADTRRIAESFAAQLKCTPPLETPVYVSTDNEPLKKDLSMAFSRNMTITTDQREAQTILAVTNRDENLLSLELVTESEGIPLAQVRLKTISPPMSLLSAINRGERKRECRGHGRHCVDIDYEIFEDSYVFEFYTKKGAMVPLTCEVPAPRSGITRYGLKVLPTETLARPSLGYYVLATRDITAARHVADALSSGSAHCGRNPTKKWTTALSTVISRYHIDWRAIHLINTRGKIRVL